VVVNLQDIASSNYDLLVRASYTSSLKTCPSPAEQNNMMPVLLSSTSSFMQLSKRLLQVIRKIGKLILFKDPPFHLFGRSFFYCGILLARSRYG